MSETGTGRAEMTGGQGFDHEIWTSIEETIAEGNHPIRDVLESFPIYARRVNLTKFLAHYELFRKIVEVPGDIVECGVYRGATLFTYAKLVEIFSAGDRIRRVIGFDGFEGLSDLHRKDGPEAPHRAKRPQGWSAASFRDEFYRLVDITHRDSFLPRFERIQMVEGDICQTVPAYVEEHPGLRIALLHMNCNLYEPTRAALDHLLPRVVRGGVVIGAEYGMKEWGGESTAFEEALADQDVTFQRLPWASQPNAYFVKR